MKTIAPHALAALVLGFSGSVMGQTMAPASPTAEPKEEAVLMNPFDVRSTRDTGYIAADSKTSTGISMALTKIPLNIQVITSQFLEDISFPSFHETLRYTSGLVIDEYNRDASGIRIRGFQNDFYYRNGVPRFQNIAVDNIDRIEVAKGPITAFFATGAPGGVVNYITKVPEFVDRGSLQTTFGTYDYQLYRGDYQGVMPGYKKLAYRLVGSYQDSNDWKQWEFTHRYFLSPMLRWRPNKVIDLTSTYEWTQSRENLLNDGRTNLQYFDDYAHPPQDVINFYRTAARSTDAQVIAFLQGRWLTNTSTGGPGITNWANDVGAARGVLIPTVTTGDMSSFYPQGRRSNQGSPGPSRFHKTWQVEEELKLHLTDWWDTRYNFNYASGFTDAYTPFANPNGDRTIPWLNRTSINWNIYQVNSLDFVLSQEILHIKHRLVFGYQILNSRIQSGTRTLNFASLGSVQHGTTILSGAQAAQFYNPFTDPVIEIQKYIGPVNPASIGVTWSSVESQYITYQGSAFNDRLSTLVGVRRSATRNAPSGTVPTVGLSYEFMPGFVGFASRSENFRINGPNITGPAAQIVPGELVPNLPAQKSIGTDLGIKASAFNNTLSATLTYYTLDNRNERTTDRIRSDLDPRNRTSQVITWFSVGGEEKNEGVELDGVWHPTRNYSLVGGYSWVPYAKIISDPSLTPGSQAYKFQIGRRLGNLPVNQFKIWNKYTFDQGPLKNLTVGAGATYVGPTSAQYIQYIFQWNNPAYTTYDMMVGYNAKLWGRTARAWISVQNVTNHIYLQGLNNEWAPPRKIFFNAKFDF